MGGVSNPVAANPASPPPINPQTGTTYNFKLSDAPAGSFSQGIVTGNNAAAQTFTMPDLAWQAGSSIQVIQLGVGQITIAAAGGVTLNTPTSLTTRKQFSTIFLVFMGAHTWTVGGDTT